MIYIVLRYDKPGADQLRDELKAKHREFLASLGNRLLLGGAIFDDAGNVIGGSITFQASNIEEAERRAEQDPYARHPEIASSTKIIPFRARWKDGEFYDGEGYSPMLEVRSENA